MSNYLDIDIKEYDEQVVLHLNGSFHAAWNSSALKDDPACIYKQMMQCAYEQGIEDAKKNLKKALGL